MDARDNEVRSERAHYMCPHMHFGILARLAAEYDGARARRSAAAVQRAHPLLQSLIAEEDGRLYYRRQEHLAVPLVEKPEAGRWPQDYEEAARRGWDVRRECLLRMTVYPQEKGFQVLFTAHHLLCDGRGLLQLAQEFARHYCLGEAPQLVEERLIRSLGDLPPHSGLPLVSRLLVDGVNKSWDDEG